MHDLFDTFYRGIKKFEIERLHRPTSIVMHPATSDHIRLVADDVIAYPVLGIDCVDRIWGIPVSVDAHIPENEIRLTDGNYVVAMKL